MAALVKYVMLEHYHANKENGLEYFWLMGVLSIFPFAIHVPFLLFSSLLLFCFVGNQIFWRSMFCFFKSRKKIFFLRIFIGMVLKSCFFEIVCFNAKLLSDSSQNKTIFWQIERLWQIMKNFWKKKFFWPRFFELFFWLMFLKHFQKFWEGLAPMDKIASKKKSIFLHNKILFATGFDEAHLFFENFAKDDFADEKFGVKNPFTMFRTTFSFF